MRKKALAVTHGDRARKERQMLRFSGHNQTHTDVFLVNSSEKKGVVTIPWMGKALERHKQPLAPLHKVPITNQVLVSSSLPRFTLENQ